MIWSMTSFHQCWHRTCNCTGTFNKLCYPTASKVVFPSRYLHEAPLWDNLCRWSQFTQKKVQKQIIICCHIYHIAQWTTVDRTAAIKQYHILCYTVVLKAHGCETTELHHSHADTQYNSAPCSVIQDRVRRLYIIHYITIKKILLLNFAVEFIHLVL